MVAKKKRARPVVEADIDGEQVGPRIRQECLTETKDHQGGRSLKTTPGLVV